MLAELALAAALVPEGFLPVVYGGKPVAEPSPLWRTVVTLDMDPGDYTAVLPCTGIIVSRRAVLTAAHCARPEAGGGIVALGLFDRAGRVWRKAPVAPASARVHPDYDAATSLADLALVPIPFELPEEYGPVALLADAARLAPGAIVEVAGVGLTEAGRYEGLRTTTLPIKEYDERDKAFSAHDPEQKTIACSGDSGGGAFLDGGATLAGVIFLAWEPVARPCSGPGTTFFQAVPSFKAWIEGTADAIAGR